MAARLSALKMKNAEGAYGFLGPLALVADFLPFLPAFFVPFFDAVVFFSLAAAFALIVARAFFAAATRRGSLAGADAFSIFFVPVYSVDFFTVVFLATAVLATIV